MGYWFLPMCIFQMYVFISFKVIIEILPVYLLRYLFWFFIFLRQVFIFRAVLLLTLCQCAALRCYISWVCIIIKPSLYILKIGVFSHVCMSVIHCAFSQTLYASCILESFHYGIQEFWKKQIYTCSFVYSLLTCLHFATINLPVVFYKSGYLLLDQKYAEGNCKYIEWPLEGIAL